MPDSNKTDIEAIVHDEAKRSNIPTTEMQAVVPPAQKAPVKIAYAKRNPDLDPQLVWRGKYDGDDTLIVKAPPLYIQEKIHPKVLIEDMRAQSKKMPALQRKTRSISSTSLQILTASPKRRTKPIFTGMSKTGPTA